MANSQPSVIYGDFIYVGNITFGGTVTIPDGTVTDAEIAASAAIEASKLQCFMRIGKEPAQPSVTVPAGTFYLFTAKAAGTLLQFVAEITGAIATGSDRTITVDLQKSTAGGALATVLSATIGFTHTSTLLVASPGTISSPNYLAGDSFYIVVTEAGSASAQATGLGCTLSIAENYV